MLAITPMWWIMWGVFLASATMPATMRAGIGLIVLTAGLLAPAPIIRYTRETGKMLVNTQLILTLKKFK